MSLTVALVFLAAMAMLPRATADDKAFPVRMVIPASQGGVTFHHFLHAQRVKFDCAVCHASLWPRNSSAKLGYGPDGHRAAEERRTGCGSCHREGGSAFASEGNCTSRCHAMYAGECKRSIHAGTANETHPRVGH
jgi:hypothetical protein